MKNNTFKVFVGLFVFCLQVNAQISTREVPVSFNTKIPALKVNDQTHKILPPINMDKIYQEDEEDEANGVPPRFGYRHEVNYTLENSGEWVDLEEGGRIWRLVISCPKALSINLLYDKFWLPEGAKFFIYSNVCEHSIGAFTSVNNKGDVENMRGFATGLVYGDQITLEYYLPAQVDNMGIISITGVVHGYRSIVPKCGYGDAPPPGTNPTVGFNKSGECNVNINCSEGNDWQKEKNAVALIVLNGERVCSGSLINNTNNDYYPYFLTACHCLEEWKDNVLVKKYDAETDPNLDHYTFYWNYELPPNYKYPDDCNYKNSTPPEPFAFSTSGAKVLANKGNLVSDFALLKLEEDPVELSYLSPPYKPYYLGWDRSGDPGTGGVGIHHPRGDVKKISTYSMTPTTLTDASGQYWLVEWNSGTTEGGSSGSPLINNDHMVIGQLSNGLASCTTINNIDWYGKFHISWIGSITGIPDPDSRRKLQPWLDPNNTTTVLDGTECNPIDFINITVTINRIIKNCNDIRVQNVTVTNGATLTIKAAYDINVQYVTVKNNSKLILDAGGNVNIIQDFEIEAGSELEIK